MSVWARFAQPSRLVCAADPAARDKAVQSIALAAPTLLTLTLPMAEGRPEPLDLWRRGFALTYECELRAERSNRSGSIVDCDPQRYRRFAEAALGSGAEVPIDRKSAERTWRALRRRGKRASVLRLAKASFTFAGGIDYLAWKINRHAGTQISLKPWQRRWPLVAAVTLLPHLLRRGAIR